MNRRHSGQEVKRNLRVLGKGQNEGTMGSTRSHNNDTQKPNQNFGKDESVIDMTGYEA